MPLLLLLRSRGARRALAIRPFLLGFSLALLSGGLPAHPASASEGGARVGDPPPPFVLKDEEGVPHALDDYRGSPTVLYFTHNMCHYCTQVIGFLKRAHARHGPEGLAIITINVWADGPEFIRRYREQFGLPFLMLAGKDRKLLRDYEVNYVPIIVFIGRDGLVRRVYHHFILEKDFHASVAEIMAEAPRPLSPPR